MNDQQRDELLSVLSKAVLDLYRRTQKEDYQSDDADALVEVMNKYLE